MERGCGARCAEQPPHLICLSLLSRYLSTVSTTSLYLQPPTQRAPRRSRHTRTGEAAAPRRAPAGQRPLEPQEEASAGSSRPSVARLPAAAAPSKAETRARRRARPARHTAGRQRQGDQRPPRLCGLPVHAPGEQSPPAPTPRPLAAARARLCVAPSPGQQELSRVLQQLVERDERPVHRLVARHHVGALLPAHRHIPAVKHSSSHA